MEQRGNLHIISVNELGVTKQSGSSKIRARCPVHSGDSPNLSITIACDNLSHSEGHHDTECSAGLGYCFTAGCNATVLVAEYNPQKAAQLGYKIEAGDLLALRTIPKSPSDNGRAKDELLMLHGVYPHAKKAISYYERAKAYLSQRGIPLDTAIEYGLGYIPALSMMKNQSEIEKIQKHAKWCDRIIFPCTTPDGKQGYSGRALHLWEVGMNEDEHKKKLEEYNEDRRAKQWREMRRWEKTNPVGYFNFAAVETAEKLVLVEGQFDALALLSSGIRDALAMGNARMPSDHIPTRICDVVIALDGDKPGKDGAKQLARELRRKGISVDVALPTAGKDWSELYRLYGDDGLAPVHAFLAPLAKVEELDERLLCITCLEESNMERETIALPDAYEGLTYCTAHHPLHRGHALTPSEILDKFKTSLSPDWKIDEIDDLAAYKAARMREIVAHEQAKDEQQKLANRRKVARR